MKQLLVIRHAKSSWDLTGLSDFERPLNERGKRDAPVMAQRLLDRNIQIDAFVASPAKRAKKTAELFCAVYKVQKEDIIFVSSLYHAPAEVFYDVIAKLDDAFNTVAIFSHNPGITNFADKLTDKVRIDDMPTCAVFAVSVNIDKWSGFKKAEKEFLFFDYPKNGI